MIQLQIIHMMNERYKIMPRDILVGEVSGKKRDNDVLTKVEGGRKRNDCRAQTKKGVS